MFDNVTVLTQFLLFECDRRKCPDISFGVGLYFLFIAITLSS
jgi:hypothetical protein